MSGPGYYEIPGPFIYIVYGPPKAGKFPYVKENKAEGAPVWQTDKIFEAITFEEGKLKSSHWSIDLCMALRERFIAYLKEPKREVPEAWIVGTMENGKWRRRVAQELNAETILVKTDKKTCLERAEGEEHIKEWIHRWFNKHQDEEQADKIIDFV